LTLALLVAAGSTRAVLAAVGFARVLPAARSGVGSLGLAASRFAPASGRASASAPASGRVPQPRLFRKSLLPQALRQALRFRGCAVGHLWRLVLALGSDRLGLAENPFCGYDYGYGYGYYGYY
jgi:hypothetical protein